jgi:hypothetical protein
MKYFMTLFLVWTFTASAQEERPMDPNARDILILTDWFEGQFDNEEQRWFFTRNGNEGEPPHRRLHAIHKRLNLPQIGEHVFHIQHYLDNDPSNVMRQRIGIFISEPEENAIRMRQGFYKDNDRARDAHLDPSKLDGLTRDDIFFVDGCDVFWVRDADQYVANMQPKACAFGEGDLYRYSVHRWTLSAAKLWLVDSSFLMSDDSLHVGMPVDQPFRLRRSKIFECEVTFRNEDGSTARKIDGIRMHSQGGLVWFNPDENGDVYGIRMRDKEYPFYSERPDFLLFSMQKKGQARMVGYALTDVDARRVGFNLGWALGYCHLEGYEFREPLPTLH